MGDASVGEAALLGADPVPADLEGTAVVVALFASAVIGVSDVLKLKTHTNTHTHMHQKSKKKSVTEQT